MEKIAAIAAGMFAVLFNKNGSGDGTSSGPAAIPSNWILKGRSEALR